MEKRLKVAKILKPQGLNGLVKLETYTDSLERFNKLKSVYVNNKKEEISSCKISNGTVYISFKNYIDRTMLEKANIVGHYIYIDRKDGIKDKDRYYIVDLIGLDILVDNNKIGKLEEILQQGATDIYIVRLNDKKQMLFPALLKVLKEVNIEKGYIALDEEVLKEIAVYED